MTAAAEKIQTHIDALPEGSLRRRTLECARRFKASWVELGRMLSEVKRGGHWREWGHGSFEAYCSKELFIRKQTAEKLTASFGFLSRHEPAMVREGAARPAPAFEVIEVLSRAEAAGQLPEEGWRDLRDEILERPPSPAALHRQLTDRYGAPPDPPRPAKGDRLKRLASLAQRLASACSSEDDVPKAVVERARALAEDLAELAES